MRCTGLTLTVTVLFLICSAPLAHGAAVTFESLLREMTDMAALTRMPDPAYTCRQFSSYDPRATDPAVLTDENWFANADRGHFLREEDGPNGREYVLMDAEGPGAIVRIWSANPGDAGNIRIYFDGADQPALDLRMDAMLGGKETRFPAPIAGVRAKGWNSYLPLPYAKHCKITTTKKDYYYHVNYRTYAPGTEVVTFDPAAAEGQLELIQATAEKLANPADQASLEDPVVPYATVATLNPESELMPLRLQGPAAIGEIRCAVKAEDMEDALRACLLEITFDGAETPSVQAPLGDFFGTAPGINAFESLPCGVLADNTLYAHWVMPFRESASIQVTSFSKQPIDIALQVRTGNYEWSGESLYFHAKWRFESGIATRPRRDWNYVTVEGQGRFAGCMLHIANPVPQWWGEGDEKIYVDGEKFPSHFGTGSEDYFGYAWCDTALFSNAYHNQPRCDGPGNMGHTCVSRFHIIDSIPFTQSLRFDMEVWHWAETVVDQAAMAYWYAAPGAADNFKKPDPEDLVIPALPDPKKVAGAIEGEDLKVLLNNGGRTQTQTGGFNWSNTAQFWWIDGKPGDTVLLSFPVEKAGSYDLRASFTKARDYGIAQLYVNNEPAGDPINFYNPDVIVTDEISLGVYRLKKGSNLLKVEITGADAKADPRHMFGLDYLKPVPEEQKKS
jgi:hypothetical protein